MKTTCKECGYPLSGTEKVCPECGCPIQCGSPIQNENIILDDYDYSQFYNCNWLLRPWHFSHNKDSEKENFDQLNDFFLLGAIAFRIILRALLAYIIITIANWILNLILVEADAPNLVFLITNLIVGIGTIVAVIYYAFKGLAKYWVPFLRTSRRMHKRYWISMAQAVKSKTLDV